MANKIEIFENTLLKLLVRRGLDADRKKVVLSEGELGYSIDTKRLHVGDGQTKGGIEVGGSRFLGRVADVTTLSDAQANDFAYSTGKRKLYVFKGGDYSDIGDWAIIGATYSEKRDGYDADDSTIVIDDDNNISVGTISAANLSKDIVGTDITLNSNNRIALQSNISVNRIRGRTSDYIDLPGTLRINSISYEWPAGGIENNSYLKSDVSGGLYWQNYIDVDSTTFVINSAGAIPVGTIMPFTSPAAAPSGWLLCNGQNVLGSSYPELSSVLGTTFGGDLSSFNVPDLINKTLYGVSNNPGSSTLYNVSSGINSSLSATGALYIIKAEPDVVANVKMSVVSPLCAALNGQPQYNNYFNPLSGTVDIGLQTTSLTGNTTIVGAFVADQYGRVLREVAIDEPDPPAFDAGPGTRPTYNKGTSPIGFFKTPPSIISNVNSVKFTISAYPYVTTYGGTLAGGGSLYSVPPAAKNLIVDSVIDRKHNVYGTQARVIASAPNISLLNGTDTTVGSTEFLVNYVKTFDRNDDVSAGGQVIVPLSATSTGDLVAAFRVSNIVGSAPYEVRVVGYTL